jgi:hypothetical protein
MVCSAVRRNMRQLPRDWMDISAWLINRYHPSKPLSLVKLTLPLIVRIYEAHCPTSAQAAAKAHCMNKTGALTRGVHVLRRVEVLGSGEGARARERSSNAQTHSPLQVPSS